MDRTLRPKDTEILRRLKWLMAFRVLFAVILLVAAVVIRFGGRLSHFEYPVLHLYQMIIVILGASLAYALWYPNSRRPAVFAGVQLGLDATFVSALILFTGGYESIFPFLYLIVIINASIILFRNGSLFIAALCSIQFGLLIDFEFYGAIRIFGTDLMPLADRVAGWHVLFRIVVMTAACFSVSILTSFLSGQLSRAKEEVLHMETYVKRMEKLAAVGEMAAGLAHEIKNPLASLTGAIELLEEELCREPDSEKLMRIVLREADRLGNLVAEFLLFARPGKGTPEPVDVAAVITETAAIQEKGSGGQSRIRYDLQLMGDLWVEMDPGRFRQVIWNLLLNAADAIPEEGVVTVVLRLEKEQQVCIRVQDTGNGIPEDLLGHIFDPFYTTKPSGSGLGLSIAARILDAAEGRIDVKSRVGEGTTFTIRLPRVIPPLG